MRRSSRTTALARRLISALVAVGLAAVPAVAGDPLLRWLFDMGDDEAVVIEATARIGSNPGDVDALYMRGVAFTRLDRADEGEHDLRRVLELEPERPRVRAILARLLLDRSAAADGDDAKRLAGEAAALLARERELGDASRSTSLDTVRALEGAGRDGEAAEMLESVLAGSASPDRGLLLYAADLHRRTGRHDLALAALARVDPPDGETAVRIYNSCVSLYRSGDDDAVIAAMPRAIAASPDSAPFHRLLGLALLRQGNEGEAMKALGRFAELAPDDPEAKKIRARIEGTGG